MLDRAEDTALLRSNRSADPEAETEERAVTARSAARTSPFGIGTKAQNLRGRMPRFPKQDAPQRSLTPPYRNSSSR